MMPLEFAEPELRPALEFAVKGARVSGTPFVSFFTPEEMISLAREAGFKEPDTSRPKYLPNATFPAGRIAGVCRRMPKSCSSGLPRGTALWTFGGEQINSHKLNFGPRSGSCMVQSTWQGST